ncbi:MAG: FAD-dependent oxidoreductase [Planctomycetota bacterium]|nr:MAG: FAD-dependent oxidoreductase [Planctomycetota bacterium]
MSEKKVAVYICKGCDIGKSINVDAIQEAIDEDYDEIEADIWQTHDCLCADEGIELIKKDIGEGANALVVAACSSRFKTTDFLFDGCFTDRVNLREHVVWSHEAGHEDTQMLANDYVAMGIARVGKAEIPEPFSEEINKTILVVGGGHSGMTAALETAKAGYEVVLVEKEDKLGGWRGKFSRVFPTSSPYRELLEPDVNERIEELQGNDKVTIHTSASIEKIAGQPGQFDVTLKTNGSTENFRVGAIIQATGWQPYDANKLGHLGYGKFKNVITNVELEEQFTQGKVTRPSDGKPAKRIAFIQCAGSRDEEHLPYCSAVCCRATLKHSIRIRELDGEAQAFVLYKDIRTPGQFEGFYLRAQEDPGIFFMKGEVEKVEDAGGDNLTVEMTDTLIDEHVKVEADLVVLATGMVPNSADGETIRKYTDSLGIIEKGEEGAQLEMAKTTSEELKSYEGTEILNLDYRQGPDFPVLKYNFPDSHFICFPYETRRTGIYAAGCMRAPNDTDACREDATGAALKAIQCLELAEKGYAVHPRWGDQSWPEFAMQRCTQCKRCTEECPFGTLNEDAKGTPLENPLRCRRCGICLGACPERIVSFKDYAVNIISAMIKAVHVPDEDEEKPRMLGLICENDAYPALDLAGMKRIQHSAFIRFIPVRCLGSVNVVWIADALSKGYDGILLVGCKSGDDYQCHYIRGSELMGTRGENIQEKLKQLALEEERVRVEEISITDGEKLVQIINEFAEQIEEVGMNPFKGF